ncbi:related to chloride channel protein 3 [Cephalotrichum gorgonifer]|uniref:Chloride channel protein n=1 Tax=Cephalotrichum gorgonifer TaxID=2041049 RepID=A0AAE8MXL7_9PEZI|nr:related to chloride channel protein 3 [Cephalotrichum gorgonifer]
MPGPFISHAEPSTPSSSRSPIPPAHTPAESSDNHDHDALASLWDDDDDHAAGDVFGDDPLAENTEERVSFKRKQKQSALSSSARFFSALTGGGGASSSGLNDSFSRDLTDEGDTYLRGVSSPPRGGAAPKDGSSLDWYVEGPRRRVAYEDMTAIDWIFEYTKERQRLRVLRSGAKGLLGNMRLLLDASQVWIILILTGAVMGGIAAGIDVATNWLGDLKTGYCSSGPDGGAFYLNKGVCCLGYDMGSKCSGWTSWGEALGVHAAGGKWAIGYLFFILFSVTLAFFAATLVKEYAIYAKHSGIPEVKTILGGFVIRGFLGTWTLVTKSLGLCLSVGSGMWLGKEGPLVHVACCVANFFISCSKTINENEARKREVLSAAAAAGISVAFGSPIGGVLFSLEQLSYYFPDKTMWQSFVCAMTASVVLQALDPFRSGQLVLYQVKYTVGWHGFELVPYAILGVLGGVYGGLFIKANMWVSRWKKSVKWLPGPVTQVVLVATFTALINYPNVYMKVQTSELVSTLLSECSQLLEDEVGICKTGAASAGTILLLILAAALGFFLSAITFGLQIPAGIILPSMAIGALTGRAVGIMMEIWVENARGSFLFESCGQDARCITPGTYAIIGAAAALAGVTRMTVSIVVITFELTGALTYVLPIMVAVMLSKWVGDAFSRKGIYESWIHLNGYPFLDNSDETTTSVPDVPASHVMTRIEDLVVLTATGHTVSSLTSVLEAHPYRGFPVISDPRDAILLGYISRAELSFTLRSLASSRRLPPEAEVFFSHQPLADPHATLDLRPWMDQTPLTLPSRAELHLAVTYFRKLGLRYLLLVDAGALVGLLTKKDVWYVLNGEEGAAREEGTRREGRGGHLAERDGSSVGDENENML